MKKILGNKKLSVIVSVLSLILITVSWNAFAADEKIGNIVGGNAVCPSGYVNSGRTTTDTIPAPICVPANQTIAQTAPPSATSGSFTPPTISGSGTTLTTDQLPAGQQCATIGYPVDVKGKCNPGDELVSCPSAGNRCVTPAAAPSGDKVTQTVHGYQTKYTIPCQPLAGGQCADEQTPAGYIARLYQFGLMIVGLFAFAGIIYGALKYVLSAGNMADQSDAKDQITQAVLGMLLLLGSFLILYTINPEITNIRNPNLEVINIKNIIKSGQADNAVNQQIPTGTAGSGDSLCKLAINGQIGFSVGADTSNSDVLGSPLFNTSGVNLPSGNQSGSRCISCKDNATKGSNGVCACNSGYSSYNGECLKPCTSGETTNCVPNAVMAGPLTCKSGTAEFDGKCISNADCLKNGAFQVVSAPIPGASSSLLVTYKCVPK